MFGRRIQEDQSLQTDQPGNQPSDVQPPIASQQVPHIPARHSGLAMVSILLGSVGLMTWGGALISLDVLLFIIVGVFCDVLTAIVGLILAPLGLILGIASLVCIRKSAGRLTGRGMAIVGIILSSMTFLVLVILPLLIRLSPDPLTLP